MRCFGASQGQSWGQFQATIGEACARAQSSACVGAVGAGNDSMTLGRSNDADASLQLAQDIRPDDPLPILEAAQV
jgi:hypothetical protein